MPYIRSVVTQFKWAVITSDDDLTHGHQQTNGIEHVLIHHLQWMGGRQSALPDGGPLSGAFIGLKLVFLRICSIQLNDARRSSWRPRASGLCLAKTVHLSVSSDVEWCRSAVFWGGEVMSGSSKTTSKKRCACGRSQSFCDSSHSSEGWTCSTLDSLPVQRAFLAGPHLVNLAERLAHGMGVAVVSDMTWSVQLNWWCWVTGPMSPGYAPVWRPLMPPEHRLLASASTSVIGWAFPDTKCVAVPDDDPSGLWNAVARAVGEAPEALPAYARPRIFLSHAVADEGRLPGLEDPSRHLWVRHFVCADSIQRGVNGSLRFATTWSVRPFLC